MATVLAIISCFFVTPGREYLSYINWRTLILLFCLMAVVAGFAKAGVFRYISRKLSQRMKDTRRLSVGFMLLCFLLSMFVTNDVALVTVVPLTLLTMMGCSEKAKIQTLVQETIAANLGSMLTPFGNPQNLYLTSYYGIGMGEFLRLMLPYTGVALVILLLQTLISPKEGLGGKAREAGVLEGRASEAGIPEGRAKEAGIPERGASEAEIPEGRAKGAGTPEREAREAGIPEGRVEGAGTPGGASEAGIQEERAKEAETPEGKNREAASLYESGENLTGKDEMYEEALREKLLRSKGRLVSILLYGILFIVSMFSVARILDYRILFGIILITILVYDRSVLCNVNYTLLLTFVSFFVLIGNLGAMTQIQAALTQMIEGRELLTAILSSQIISNVPAAVLLSGFTDQGKALIVGTNLGGLGTLIASMASIITFQLYSLESGAKKGKYLLTFTLWNVIDLVILGTVAYCMMR
ncbi:MAG: SLC13 family permease [Lachnospiraceae bacterium]|nr:SLC13 family permease [Lachnospiraceae bacterium]